MEEIRVTTNITFTTDDGTAYNRIHTYFSDANSEASRPKRYMIGPDSAGGNALLFGSVPNYRTQLTGPSLLMLVNRDDRVDIIVQILTANLVENRKLRPGEWVFLDVCEGDSAVIGGGGAFTYSAEPLTTISSATAYQSAPAEILCIYKAAS